MSLLSFVFIYVRVTLENFFLTPEDFNTWGGSCRPLEVFEAQTLFFLRKLSCTCLGKESRKEVDKESVSLEEKQSPCPHKTAKSFRKDFCIWLSTYSDRNKWWLFEFSPLFSLLPWAIKCLGRHFLVLFVQERPYWCFSTSNMPKIYLKDGILQVILSPWPLPLPPWPS